MIHVAASAAGSHESISFGILALAVWGLLMAAAILGVGKAKREAAAHDASLNRLFPNAETRSIFHSMCASRKKSVVATYVLSVVLSPTIGYAYLGEWGMAEVSFLSLQGLGVWWVLGIFTAWSWAIQHNKRIETEVIKFFLSHMDGEPAAAVEVA